MLCEDGGFGKTFVRKAQQPKLVELEVPHGTVVDARRDLVCDCPCQTGAVDGAMEER